jgi:hypothetical protein
VETAVIGCAESRTTFAALSVGLGAAVAAVFRLVVFLLGDTRFVTITSSSVFAYCWGRRVECITRPASTGLY